MVVEGEWKNFVFTLLNESNKAKAYEHLKQYFYEDELVCSQFGRSTEECAGEFERFYDAVVPQNLSFMAAEKDTGEVAGVIMIALRYKDQDVSSLTNFQSPQLKNLANVVLKLEEEVNFPDRFGITEFASFLTASTNRKHREMGLMTEMFRRSLELLKATKTNIKYVKSVHTSPWTTKALGNLGFKELARIRFKDLQVEDNGEQLFPNLPDALYANFMYREV